MALTPLLVTPDAALQAPLAAHGRGLTKVYGAGDTRVVALDHVDVSFPRGCSTAIMGPSGSGKSTLMHCMAGLDGLTEGQAWIGETELSELNDKHLTALRRDQVGFVFQTFNLLPTLTALVTRIRTAYDWRRPAGALLGVALMERGDFAMLRRMLRGIKARAEAARTDGGTGLPAGGAR